MVYQIRKTAFGFTNEADSFTETGTETHFRFTLLAACTYAWCFSDQPWIANLLRFSILCFSDHFAFVFICAHCVAFIFLGARPSDWLGRMSAKWPILCRLGRETFAQSVKVSQMCYWFYFLPWFWTCTPSWNTFNLLTSYQVHWPSDRRVDMYTGHVTAARVELKRVILAAIFRVKLDNKPHHEWQWKMDLLFGNYRWEPVLWPVWIEAILRHPVGAHGGVWSPWLVHSNICRPKDDRPLLDCWWCCNGLHC